MVGGGEDADWAMGETNRIFQDTLFLHSPNRAPIRQ